MYILYYPISRKRVKCTTFWWSFSHAVMSVVNAQHSMPAQSLTSSGRMKKILYYLYLHSCCTYSTHNYIHTSNIRGNISHNCSMQPVFVACTNELHVMSALACHLGKQFLDITCTLHNNHNHICTQINSGPSDRYIIGIFWITLSIWVNYNNSLTWIVRPFGDDSPY